MLLGGHLAVPVSSSDLSDLSPAGCPSYSLQLPRHHTDGVLATAGAGRLPRPVYRTMLGLAREKKKTFKYTKGHERHNSSVRKSFPKPTLPLRHPGPFPGHLLGRYLCSVHGDPRPICNMSIKF